MRNIFRNTAPDGDARHSPARRELLRVAALLLAMAAGGMRGASAATAPDARLLQNLQQLALRLFPHPWLANDHYAEVAAALLGQAAGDAKLATLLDAGVDALNAGNATAWLERSEAQQIAAIRRLEGSGFFRKLRRATIEHLYRDRAVWDEIGYEGSSVEFGGYVNRGFDDIDWLPDESEER